MLKDFKKFVLRGNAVDLAVAVVIGAAFGSVVTALVKDIFTPIIAAIAGKADFSTLSFTLHGSKLLYGDVINALVSFLSIAAVIFFFVIQPINKLTTLANRRHGEPEKKTRDCPQCLSEIPKQASRCKYCTAKVQPVK